MNLNEQRIREFAYQIWESEGKPHGHTERHWDMASKLAQVNAVNAITPELQQTASTEPAPSVEPIVPISPTQPAQPVPPSDPIQPTDPVTPSQPIQPGAPVAQAQQTAGQIPKLKKIRATSQTAASKPRVAEIKLAAPKETAELKMPVSDSITDTNSIAAVKKPARLRKSKMLQNEPM